MSINLRGHRLPDFLIALPLHFGRKRQCSPVSLDQGNDSSIGSNVHEQRGQVRNTFGFTTFSAYIRGVLVNSGV